MLTQVSVKLKNRRINAFNVEIFDYYSIEISPRIARNIVNRIIERVDIGSLSSDLDGNPLTYSWTAPSEITISSFCEQKPTFIAPEVTSDTDFTFSLVVNDGTVESPVDHVVITVLNSINTGLHEKLLSKIKVISKK